MTASGVTLSRDGAVAIIAIGTRPDACMDEDTVDGLTAAIDRAEADPGLRVLVLTGAERGRFIRHFALDVLRDRGTAMRRRGLAFDLTRPVPEVPYHRLLRRIETMSKPVIAALTGTAMGGGFELALACDLRIAERGPYRLGLPEVNVGLLPGAGGTQRLARLLGEARALEILLLGRTFTPDEAASHGLVTEVADDARARALTVAAELAAKSPAALAHIKHLIRGALGRPIENGLADERTLFADLMISDDALRLMDDAVGGRRTIEDRP